MNKKMYVRRSWNFLDWLQSLMALLVAFLFIGAMFPLKYDDVIIYLTILVIVIFVMSIIRLKIFNIIIEFLILVIFALSFIPFLGAVFKLLGFIMAIIDFILFAALRNSMHIIVPRNKEEEIKVYDVNYKEK